MTTAAMRSFAIIPSAGRSVRMGQPKLLLRWGQTTIIEHVLAAWRAGGVTSTVIVVRSDDHELARVARDAGAHVVVPDVPPPQMKDSVEAGLQFIARNFQPGPGDIWLMAPADVPNLAANVIS